MIPTIKEGIKWQKIWGAVKERCFFCKAPTVYWHWRTNQPVCQVCAKSRKVSELEKCTPTYRPPTREQWMKSQNEI